MKKAILTTMPSK